MSDHTVRLLTAADELRTSWNLFRGTLHVKPGSDEEWDRIGEALAESRVFAAFDPELIGTVRSAAHEVVVPGGARLPLAAVTGVGVRAGRTRRGVLSALQTAQLQDFAERGTVLASLHATEGAIYGRYGYGVSTLSRTVVVDRRQATLRPEAPAGGEVSVFGLEQALLHWPDLYGATGTRRPGMITRPAHYWPMNENQARRLDGPVETAVHRGPDGVDGYVVYHVERGEGDRQKLTVFEFHYTDPGAFAGLWRFLLSVDLVDDIVAIARPLDEPVELLFTDPRAAKITGVEDETWLRLIDVPAGLAARTYGPAEPVVLEVTDRLLPANDGRYRVGPDGAERTDTAPALRLDVSALAMLYFGAWPASALADTGRLEVLDDTALSHVDTLFGTRRSSWCGTFF
ncbi:GNAT family N-acetyltransferase [Amycolatopsis rhabdoformis]|uniref:GNAT family N-acetyltransferase n=1 Tax=Amycolatopsis rhabdoformis TaxID=1448059 RepID=A0ABZ1IF73_9PSEU|nr:GNAT family N-acetyltransferase [Amycolatopsis rhabdoformis]WSE33057.1 GNAT family N-acetyltransferase [Amycolatopsis rhabdoformis]